MFVKELMLKSRQCGNGDAYDFASHSLYRNEGSVEDNNDGFRIFLMTNFVIMKLMTLISLLIAKGYLKEQ